jgi:phosphate transport system protein
MQEHIIKRFDDELLKLRVRLVKMGTLIQEQIKFAIKAFATTNIDFANVIIENEEKIDKIDIKIDKQCLRIFALHQPVATDLRLVMSALSINDYMEQIGDLAVNIAENVLKIKNGINSLRKTKIIELGAMAENMIYKVMDSFIYSDAELARQILKYTPEIENLFNDNFNKIIELMKEEPADIENLCYYSDINRNLQFIAKEAVSIAQEVVFLVDAKLIKHQNVDIDPNDRLLNTEYPPDDSDLELDDFAKNQ